MIYDFPLLTRAASRPAQPGKQQPRRPAFGASKDSVFFSGAGKAQATHVYREKPVLPRVNVYALQREFANWAGRKPETVTFGPNRVNLIGEHTDYNDGFVLPIAMEIGNYVAAAPRKDRVVRIRTMNPMPDQKAELKFNLDSASRLKKGSWGNYAKGTIRMIEKHFGIQAPGMDILIQSDGPSSSGLSSSAAFETAVGMAVLQLSGKKNLTEADRVKLALAGQEAEHTYAGVKCGIMDQAASGLCRPDHALKLDCRMTPERSYNMEHVPVNFPGAVFVVMDTLLARKLEKSEYNERRSQCEEAVAAFRNLGLPDVKALRDIDPGTFEQHQAKLPEMTRKRARHVVGENDRAVKAVEALKRGDAAAFGKLMNASHDSLRDDYEVSGEHLNTLVNTARNTPGVYGARLTGAGFGGCAVALVKQENLADFQRAVREAYKQKFDVEPAFYVTRASAGAREVEA